VQFHQVVVGAHPGDAITQAALAARDLLRQVGPSEVFGYHVHPDMADEVFKLRRLDSYRGRDARDDIIMYHASIGEPAVHEFILGRPERLVIVYHNISPPAPYTTYDPPLAGLLEAGRKDLAELKDRVTLALADSAFNAAELAALGYRDVRVSPLIIDPAALHGVEPDDETAEHLRNNIRGPVVLFVGQILPHKRPELLIQAFHVLSTYLVPEANLVLAGHLRIPRFAGAIRAEIQELGLRRAWLTGSVSTGALRSIYERADVFATASDHEGFCVPLIEAMSFNLPVVARATTAIPETVGDAGVLIEADDGPTVMAEALAEVLTNAPLRSELVERGRTRLGEFDPDRARTALLENLLSVA
jgi:glycosyltransferase involved in cell wall biosynthesis